MGKSKPSVERYVALMKSREYTSALGVLDALLDEFPEVALSWRARCGCLFELSRFDEAIEAFQRAYDLGVPGTEEVLLWKAFCYQNSGQKSKAEVLVEQIIQSESDDVRRARAQEVLIAFQST
ncbi:MAG: tetratricopeptide repeat protein [Planctomycetota bacterium]